MVAVVRATTDDDLLLVAGNGTGHRVALADIPVVKARHRGTAVAGLLGDDVDDLVGAVPLVGDATVVFVSANGQVKRTEVEEYRSNRSGAVAATGLKDGDRVAAVLLCADDDDLVLATSDGMVTRFAAE